MKTDMEDPSDNASQLCKMRRFMISFAILLATFTCAACIIGFLFTGSWAAFAGLIGLLVPALFFWRAHPMSEQTYQRKLRKIRKKARQLKPNG